VFGYADIDESAIRISACQS